MEQHSTMELISICAWILRFDSKIKQNLPGRENWLRAAGLPLCYKLCAKLEQIFGSSPCYPPKMKILLQQIAHLPFGTWTNDGVLGVGRSPSDLSKHVSLIIQNTDICGQLACDTHDSNSTQLNSSVEEHMLCILSIPGSYPGAYS